MRSLHILLLTVVFALVAAGCGRDTPPPDDPDSDIEGSGPRLTVIAPVVTFRERESEPATEIDAGTTVAIEPGANVTVDDGGRAAMIWPEFLTHDMLAGTDTLLSYSEHEQRSVILDQASGTGRYVLEGEGEPADLKVVAHWIETQVNGGEADLLVSFIPGEEPSAWVAVLTGVTEINRGSETLTVAAGQAVGLTEIGDLPEVLDVDVTAVSAWYEEAAENRAEGTIATIALRCVVNRNGAKLRASPDHGAESVGQPLRADTLTSVLQGHDSSDWLYVSPITALRAGWMPTSELSCNGPVGDAPDEGVEAAELATPTATSEPPPRATAVPRPVAPVITPTPVATPTAGGTTVVKFWADDDSIDLGDCTHVRWEVQNIREVYLNGEGVPGGVQAEKVCPEEDTTYTLKVIHLDGSVEEKSLVVEVDLEEEPDATDTSEPAATETTSTVPTDPPTQEPATPEPTTQVPTDEPEPTDVPEPDPTDKPTDEPEPAP